jgi:hypothetical protein
MKLWHLRWQVHRLENLLGDVLELDESDQAELGLALRAHNFKPEWFSQELGPTDIPRSVLGLVQLGERGSAGVSGAMPLCGRHQGGESRNEGQWSQFHRRGAIRPRLLELQLHVSVVEGLEPVVGERRAQDGGPTRPTLRPLWVQKKFPELPVSTPWLDWPAELCTTYDLDTMPQELNWAGWGTSEPLDEGFVVQSDNRLGKFVQAADEEHIVSSAPPLPPLSIPAKEPPEPSSPPPVAPEPQPILPLPSEQLHQLLAAHAEDLDDPRPGDPFAGFPDDT